MLMNTILKEGVCLNTRMVILKTQICNENAISFYKKFGFEMIGFDLYSYFNMDINHYEVCVEIGKILERK